MVSLSNRNFITLITINVYLVFGLNINQNLVGIEFSPFITAAENGGSRLPKSAFKFKTVKTMMDVVSTKFTRVLIRSVDALNVPYKKNHSYYHGSSIRARTAEAAALINRENNNRSLTVMIGASNYDNWDDSVRWNAEINVAIEAAQIANSIYPGTVEGIFLTRHKITSLKWAEFNLRWILKLRNLTAGLGLKIGSEEFCVGLSPTAPSGGDENTIKIWALRKQIAMVSDILFCGLVPSYKDAKDGIKYIYPRIRSKVVNQFEAIKLIKPGLDVMWSTYWPGSKHSAWNTVENYGDYFYETNEMAKGEGLKVYLGWALENLDNAHSTMGWWQLTKKSLIHTASGYIETVSGKRAHVEANKSLPKSSKDGGNDFYFSSF